MDKLAIRELFEDLLIEYDSAANAVECEWGDCDIEKNVTPVVEEYRNRFDTLLSADNWQTWPDEVPPLVGLYLCILMTQAWSMHICAWTGNSWDIPEATMAWYGRLTHWRELPEPPVT